MRILKYALSIVAAVLVAGCAHPLVISPDVSKIQADATATPVKKTVAYYIADDVRNQEVTTPGGGGDKVSYHPYRDFETAFYKMLTNVFGDVVKLKSANDAETIKKSEVAYVISPQLVTDSSSPSPFTWPPTKFTVDFSCTIKDADGNDVVTKKVQGQGNAEFSEFKSDFALSGKRAMQDALLKMQKELLAAQELRK